ncbi:MAG: hypothetical protein ACM3QW_08995, partial [Ignavibacteriales bacterium]
WHTERATSDPKFLKRCEKCHTDMYPYEELPENVKDYDRVTVKAVLQAIDKLGIRLIKVGSIGGRTMKELINPLLTTNYTRVFHEDPQEMKFNAPHHFVVTQAILKNEDYQGNSEYVEPKTLAEINFQEGPIKECGVNGVCNEDLLVMVLTRLEHFQKSEFNCRENALAITKIEEALMWLRKRTTAREMRGVEGTHTV